MSQCPPDIELLPCPFCGGRGVFYENKVDFVPKWSIGCGGCYVDLDVCEDEKQEAATHWNTRATQPAAAMAQSTEGPRSSAVNVSALLAGLSRVLRVMESARQPQNGNLMSIWEDDIRDIKAVESFLENIPLDAAQQTLNRDDVYRAIESNVRSEADKHFIDRRWLVGVNDAVDAILALSSTTLCTPEASK